MALSPTSSRGTTGVATVAATDTSIVVAGTATAPTIATGTLDVIAADHPPAADWSNNSKKITGLANGTLSTDAATFGQISAAASALTLICSQIAISSNQASFDTNTILGGNIPSTYHSLLVVTYIRGTDAAAQFALLAVNADTTNANYARQYTSLDTAAGASQAADRRSPVVFSPSGSPWGAGQILFPDYTNAAQTKSWFGDSVYISSGTVERVLGGGYWNSNAAITRLSLTPATGSVQAGSSFYLYGIT